MRDIKFRGLSNGEWVYGNLFKFNGVINKDQCYISDYGSMIDHTLSMNSDEVAIGYFKEVDNKTVGQYTGLKDKNGTEIYEGDIVTGYIEHSGGYLRKNFPRKVKVVCEVIFDRGKFKTTIKKPIPEHQYAYENGDYRTDYYSLRPQFKNASYYRPSDGKRVAGDGKTCEYIEIIGNVFEHSELLEADK